MPLSFIPNDGQVDKQVAFYIQGKDKTLYFTPAGVTFVLVKPLPGEDHFRPIPVGRIHKAGSHGRDQPG